MRSALFLAAVVGLAAPTLAAPIEVVDPQDPINYVPVRLVATPLDAVLLSTSPPALGFSIIVPGTPPESRFWLARTNRRLATQLRGWDFGRTTWFGSLDLEPEINAESITLTVSTEPVNGDMEVDLGFVDRFWTIDGGTPRTVLRRAIITPEPCTLALAVYAAFGISFHRRRRVPVIV